LNGISKEIQRRKKMINDSTTVFLEEISKVHFDTSIDFINFCLEKIIQSTNSTIGYFYYYNEKNEKFTLHAWSKNVMNSCKIMNPKTLYDLKDTGCWGDVVRERKEFIINDYQHYSKSKGIPEGHVPLQRVLMIPIYENGEIVATMGLANKEEEYTEEDLRNVKNFGIFLWYMYELKQKEEKLKSMIKEKEILMEEIFHRVKNSLQLTTSLLSIPMSSMKDEYYFNLFENTINRIQVIALTMENIYKSASDTQFIYLKKYCEDIINSCKQDHINIHYEISDSKLISKYATSFGLILNELITNSMKHAFFNINNPKISIIIDMIDNIVTLNYKDNGIGIQKNTHEGLGSIVINSLVEQIKGTVTSKSENGYNFHLTFNIGK